MHCDEDGVPVFAKRGGARNVKILPHHKEFIVSLLEDPVLGIETARQVNEKLFEEFQLIVSDSTVNRAMHCLTFTKKKKTHVSHTANTEINLQKRQDYAVKLSQYKSEGKKIVYLDETNYNLHCTRNYAWSKVGTRAPKYRMSSKGANLVILGAMSAHEGPILVETKFGSITKEVHDDWIKRVVDKTSEVTDISNVIFVIDNAPCHSKLETRPVCEYLTDKGADILRLGPYSAPLNRIELMWNTGRVSCIC